MNIFSSKDFSVSKLLKNLVVEYVLSTFAIYLFKLNKESNEIVWRICVALNI